MGYGGHALTRSQAMCLNSPMNPNTTLYGRAFRSPIQHIVRASSGPAWETLCGKDARAMARYRMSDLPSGTRNIRTCDHCRTILHPNDED